MLIELIATALAGIVVAAFAWYLRRFLPGEPGWVVPVAAGLAMLTMTVFMEYTWFSRTAATLPEGVEVAASRADSALWRPWTYLFPLTDRFVAVDGRAVLSNDALGQKMTEIYIFGRWEPPRRVRSAFDCAGGRRADLPPGTTVDEDGRLEGVVWHDYGPSDPLAQVVCGSA